MDESAGAVVADVDRRGGHGLPTCRGAKGAEQAQLLAPPTEAHPRLGAEDALQRSLARTGAKRELLEARSLRGIPLERFREPPRPTVARRRKLQRGDRQAPDLVHNHQDHPRLQLRDTEGNVVCAMHYDAAAK